MLVAGILDGLTSDAVGAVAGTVAAACADLLKTVFAGISASTTVNPVAVWFSGGPSSLVGIIAAVGASLLVGLFLLQVVTSLVRQQGRGLLRAVTGTLKAVVWTVLFIGATSAVLSFTDGLCTYVVASAGTTLGALPAKLVDPAGLSSMAASGLAGAGVVILLGVLVFVCGVIFYGAMVLRKVIILAVLLFGPIVFVGQVFDGTRPWLKRWTEILLAFIFAKLAVVIFFVLGSELFAGGGITGMLGGLVVLAMAALSPWLILRMIPFAEGAVAGAVALHGTVKSSPLGSPMQGSLDAASQASQVHSMMRPLLAGATGARLGSAAAGASTVAATAAGGAGGGTPEGGGTGSDTPPPRPSPTGPAGAAAAAPVTTPTSDESATTGPTVAPATSPASPPPAAVPVRSATPARPSPNPPPTPTPSPTAPPEKQEELA